MTREDIIVRHVPESEYPIVLDIDETLHVELEAAEAEYIRDELDDLLGQLEVRA